MNWLTVAAAFFIGAIAGAGFMIWLIVRSHRNVTAAFHASPEK